MADEKQPEVKQASFDGANLASQIMFGKPLKIDKPAEVQHEEKKPEVIETPLMKVTVQPDDFYKKMSQETGFNFEKEEDFVNTLKKFKEFESKEEEYLKGKKLGDDYIAFFNNLPDDLKRAIVDYGAGQDYKATIKQVFGGGDVDYQKSWNEYDSKEPLIKKYGEITAEEWDEMEEPAKKIAEKAAKKAYETERASFINEGKQRATDFEKQRKEYTDKVISSVDKAVDKLKKDLPDMDAKRIMDVKNKMLTNPLKDLLNDEGVYKEDAATKIAFAYYGQETVQQLTQRLNTEANEAVIKARKEASQGALENHIRNANDKPPAGEDRQDKNPIEENIKSVIKGISFEPSSGFRNRQQP